MRKEAKPILRHLLKHFRKYGNWLDLKGEFKAYRYGYGAINVLDKMVGDDEELFYDVKKLYYRYEAFTTYLDEISWVKVATHNYADNSIEEEQKNIYTGETRYVMVLAPSGDVCY